MKMIGHSAKVKPDSAAVCSLLAGEGQSSLVAFSGEVVTIVGGSVHGNVVLRAEIVRRLMASPHHSRGQLPVVLHPVSVLFVHTCPEEDHWADVIGNWVHRSFVADIVEQLGAVLGTDGHGFSHSVVLSRHERHPSHGTGHSSMRRRVLTLLRPPSLRIHPPFRILSVYSFQVDFAL